MVAYVNGVPVPTVGEVGWGDEMSEYLTQRGKDSINPADAPYGAIPGTDATAAFVAAIAAMVSTGIHRMEIPGYSYTLDGDAIRAAIPNGAWGWKFGGAGSRTTRLIAKAGASAAWVQEEGQRCAYRDITFQGRGKSQPEMGFRSIANAQGHLFSHVSFEQAAVGCSLEPLSVGSPTSQNDKHTFLACVTADNAVGLHCASLNDQCQLWLGGSHDSNDVSVKVTKGWYQQVGGMVQHSGGLGTAFLLEDVAQMLILDNVITEAEDISVDIQGMVVPATVFLRGCYLQGRSYTVRCTGSPKIISEATTFNGGVFDGGSGSAIWYSREDQIDGLGGAGGTYAPGSLTLRYRESGSVRQTWGGSQLNREENAAGYTDYRVMAEPASPSVNYVRLFALNSNGKLNQKNSDATKHDLW